MRTKFSGFGILAVVLLATCHASGQTPMKWESDLQNAASRAAMLNRLVLVHFWAPWCTACHKMEKEVFSQPDVQSAIQANYVAVRLNVDHNRALAERYGITQLPTDVVIAPDGRLLERQPGFTDRYQYVARLRQIALDARRRAPTPIAAANPPLNPTMANQGYTSSGHSAPPPVPAWPEANRQQQQQMPPIASIPGGPTQNHQMAPPAPELNAQNAPNPGLSYQPPPMTGPYANPQIAQGQPPLQPPTGPAANWQPPQQMNNTYTQQQPHYGENRPGPALPPIAQAPPRNELPLHGPEFHEPMQSAPVNPPVANNPSPPVPPTTPDACPFAMDGFCPVELVENKTWKLGDVRWGANHRGRTYLFSGPEQQQRFLKSPDRYSPAASGIDVVLALTKQQVTPGRREYGVFCANRIFLFAGEESLAAFSAEPERYINQLHSLDQPHQGPAERQ